MASQMFTKVCAISARALAPIYEATNGQYGFVCLQVDPREIRNTQAMIDQVHFWNRAMAKELNMDKPNVVYKLPAVEASLPAVKVLLEEGYRLCMTLNFSITQHMAFAELLSKGRDQEYLVLMAGPAGRQDRRPSWSPRAWQTPRSSPATAPRPLCSKSYRMPASAAIRTCPLCPPLSAAPGTSRTPWLLWTARPS